MLSGIGLYGSKVPSEANEFGVVDLLSTSNCVSGTYCLVIHRRLSRRGGGNDLPLRGAASNAKGSSTSVPGDANEEIVGAGVFTELDVILWCPCVLVAVWMMTLGSYGASKKGGGLCCGIGGGLESVDGARLLDRRETSTKLRVLV